MEVNDQTVIIFEGPDNCGKTEMGKELSRVLGIPYFKMNTEHENWRKGRFKEALEFDQPWAAQFIKQTRTSCILDRMYPSEWVYSKVFRRSTNEEVLRQVDQQFADMGALIIIPMRHQWLGEDRNDEIICERDLPIIRSEYFNFMGFTKCSVLNFFVDDPNINCDLEKEMNLILNSIPLIKSNPGTKLKFH